jgi:hypothetical protein
MSLEVIQGMGVDSVRVGWLRGWVEENRAWSRKRLARELCVAWNWRNEQGRLKDFAARSFLLKLEARGLIQLPPLQVEKRRIGKAVSALTAWEEPSGWEGSLKELGSVGLEVMKAGSSEFGRWAFLLERYHYLGFRQVGENLGYLACDSKGAEVACLLFGAPAWRCRARDTFLGWKSQERAWQLSRVANNTRFLVLPWLRVPHLASHLLGRVAARIQADWQDKYGHGLDWLETFVDTTRYRGTCYQAANWQRVGETTGRTRQDRTHSLKVSRKAVYLYRLHR